jgi:sec-independent protein translocase protein TatA
MTQVTQLAFGFPGGWEWLLILAVALLIFGKRLPDVARSMGKSIVEFKKGLHDIKDEMDQAGELPDNKSSAKPAAKGKVEPHDQEGD